MNGYFIFNLPSDGTPAGDTTPTDGDESSGDDSNSDSDGESDNDSESDSDGDDGEDIDLEARRLFRLNACPLPTPVLPTPVAGGGTGSFAADSADAAALELVSRLAVIIPVTLLVIF